MTEQEEKALIEGNKAMGEQLKNILATIEPLKAVAAKVPELEKSLSEKDAKITELAKGHANFTQEAAFLSLKSKYPDVPESVLKALPEAQRDTLAAELQKGMASKVNANAETDPMKLWASAGGIAPATEAEAQAQQAAKQKDYDDAKSRGSVGQMLHARMAEIVRHVASSPAFKR